MLDEKQHAYILENKALFDLTAKQIDSINKQVAQKAKKLAATKKLPAARRARAAKNLEKRKVKLTLQLKKKQIEALISNSTKLKLTPKEITLLEKCRTWKAERNKKLGEKIKEMLAEKKAEKAEEAEALRSLPGEGEKEKKEAAAEGGTVTAPEKAPTKP